MSLVSTEFQDPTEILPFEVSCVIFSFIPAENLVNDCVLVCRFWKQISDDNTTWRLKCERTRRYMKKYMRNFEPENWKEYYYKNPYSKNLIQNPNLSDAFPNILVDKRQELYGWHGYGNLSEDQWHAQFKPWQMMNIGGDGIQLEYPPIGCGPVPNGDLGCLATSFGPTKRCQVIDLMAEGVTKYIMDECKLPIYVCEWFNNRYDCGVKYVLKVSLLDSKRNKISDCKVKFENERPRGEHEWEKFEHTFRNYPPGVRFINFKDYGKDTSHWAGYYGAKLAGATVRFLLE